MKLTVTSVIKDLKKLGSSKRAKASLWFFKIGKGQYGYGDVFWGLTVPEQRKVAKRYDGLSLKEISRLLKSKIHECRFTALVILISRYRASNVADQKKIARFYLIHKKWINNWDLVDTSAPHILGDYLLNNNRSILYKLARSKNLWDKRIAIIATFAFIRESQFSDTLALAKILLEDKHDLIHKAVGWALREVGNKSRSTEEKFLKKYVAVMPRTMLRYAIEKFTKKDRQKYLTMRFK